LKTTEIEIGNGTSNSLIFLTAKMKQTLEKFKNSLNFISEKNSKNVSILAQKY